MVVYTRKLWEWNVYADESKAIIYAQANGITLPRLTRDQYRRVYQPSIPIKPSKPTVYQGPNISNLDNVPLEELKLIGGYGYPTIGLLDFAKGTKNYGVRG